MTITKRIAKIEESLKQQRRTLANLESMHLPDNGSTIEMTKRIIETLEAHKAIAESRLSK